MTTRTLMKNALPEYTLGRSGHDLFSNPKDLTVIMIPFERFSPFAKAVDDLYKTIDVPFNLIVVEGNAPESVRASLEQRQRKHKNITIIYSDHQTSIGAAINLATPHLKTKYAFIMDNDVRIPKGAVSQLMKGAAQTQCGMICPQNYVILSPGIGTGNGGNVQSLGIRTCFLISQKAIQKLGKLDENTTAFTMGIDIRMAAEELGITIFNETETRIELGSNNFLWPMDSSLHSFQWNEERVFDSLKGLEKKWGIRLNRKDYLGWLRTKKQDLMESQNPLMFLAGMLSRIKPFNHEKETPQPFPTTQQKNFHDFLIPRAA